MKELFDSYEVLDAGINYCPRFDAGMKSRCFDCMSQVRIDNIRCESCAYKYERRIAAQKKSLSSLKDLQDLAA